MKSCKEILCKSSTTYLQTRQQGTLFLFRTKHWPYVRWPFDWLSQNRHPYNYKSSSPPNTAADSFSSPHTASKLLCSLRRGRKIFSLWSDNFRREGIGTRLGMSAWSISLLPFLVVYLRKASLFQYQSGFWTWWNLPGKHVCMNSVQGLCWSKIRLRFIFNSLTLRRLFFLQYHPWITR